MFNPIPDISQRAIIIFYVCAVVLSGCDCNIKALSDGKKRPINPGFVCTVYFIGTWYFLLAIMFYKYRLLLCKYILILHLLIYHREWPLSATVSALMGIYYCTSHAPPSQLRLCSPIVVKGVILAGTPPTVIISVCDLWWYGLLRCPQLCDCSNEAIKWAAWNKAGTQRS